jgi:hypothetical protein
MVACFGPLTYYCRTEFTVPPVAMRMTHNNALAFDTIVFGIPGLSVVPNVTCMIVAVSRLFCAYVPSERWLFVSIRYTSHEQ